MTENTKKRTLAPEAAAAPEKKQKRARKDPMEVLTEAAMQMQDALKNVKSAVDSSVDGMLVAYEAAEDEIRRQTKTLESHWRARAAVERATAALDERIVLNVGGTRFETCKSTLLRVPETYFTACLGSATWRERSRDATDGSYFIDSDPLGFDRVLQYLRTGTLADAASMDEATRAAVVRHCDYFLLPLPPALAGAPATLAVPWLETARHHEHLVAYGRNTVTLRAACGTAHPYNIYFSAPAGGGASIGHVQLRLTTTALALVQLHNQHSDVVACITFPPAEPRLEWRANNPTQRIDPPQRADDEEIFVEQGVFSAAAQAPRTHVVDIRRRDAQTLAFTVDGTSASRGAGAWHVPAELVVARIELVLNGPGTTCEVLALE